MVGTALHNVYRATTVPGILSKFCLPWASLSLLARALAHWASEKKKLLARYSMTRRHFSEALSTLVIYMQESGNLLVCMHITYRWLSSSFLSISVPFTNDKYALI